MSQIFTWGGQSTGISASASVLPVNTQDWSPLGWVQTPGVDQECLWCHNSVFMVNFKESLCANMALGRGVTRNLHVFLPLLSPSSVLCFTHFRYINSVKLWPLASWLSGTSVLWLDPRTLCHDQEIMSKQRTGVNVRLTVLPCLLSHAWKPWIQIFCPVFFFFYFICCCFTHCSVMRFSFF